jgi:tRNA(Leu) C34 or U34 (ribose-2'-O)-methylase TrmL
MKGYKDVTILHDERFIDRFESDVVPVCVEIREGSENLAYFEHPENALYIFGPEDGGVPKWVNHHCHRFLYIPTSHCLNLAAAICTILYDRRAKRVRAGLEPNVPLHELMQEHRGFISDS